MSAQVPTGERRAAIISGEFVPLTVEEFRNGYATFSDGLDGKLPRDPDFPTEYHDAVTGHRQACRGYSLQPSLDRRWQAVHR
jgi:hypothetical protein